MLEVSTESWGFHRRDVARRGGSGPACWFALAKFMGVRLAECGPAGWARLHMLAVYPSHESSNDGGTWPGWLGVPLHGWIIWWEAGHGSANLVLVDASGRPFS